MRSTIDLLKRAFAAWSGHGAPRLAAALAYYTIFSIAPLLIMVIAVASFVLEEEAVRGAIAAQLTGLIGRQGAEAIQAMIANAGSDERSGIVATVLSLVALIMGATGVFLELQSSLNTMWDVEARSAGFWGTIRKRVLSFGMVVGIAFLLLVSLVVTAVVSAMTGYIGGFVPGADYAWQVVEIAVSLALTTLLFAMLYKFLPDVHLEWRDVWFGAATTAFLFTIGKTLIGLYLGRSSVTSAFGAAGSVVVLLLWIYYSAQIVFFGAALTQVQSARLGKPRPTADAREKTVETTPAAVPYTNRSMV